VDRRETTVSEIGGLQKKGKEKNFSGYYSPRKKIRHAEEKKQQDKGKGRRAGTFKKEIGFSRRGKKGERMSSVRLTYFGTAARKRTGRTARRASARSQEVGLQGGGEGTATATQE